MWLKVRKNRPLGSVLVRACSCALTGKNFCAACQVGSYMVSFKAGDLLWEFGPREFIGRLRDTLTKKCKAPNGVKASFKSFRVGKATQLLKQNVQAPVIMDRAEWKHPKTIAKFADEDLIDPNQVLLAHIEKSDDEDEEDMQNRGFLGVTIEPNQIQSPDAKTGHSGATMGDSPEASAAESPATTPVAQATDDQPNEKRKKIDVGEL